MIGYSRWQSRSEQCKAPSCTPSSCSRSTVASRNGTSADGSRCRQVGQTGRNSSKCRYLTGFYPIITVGQQGGRILPKGDGIGATQDKWAVISFALAAGIPPIRTVVDPIAIIPGPPGTQLGSEHGAVVSVTRAAGNPPIKTVACPLMMANGSAGCGTGVGTGAAGCMGAWQCGALCKTRSDNRAAGFPMRVGLLYHDLTRSGVWNSRRYNSQS